MSARRDIHWYFPLERPKRVAASKLREKLEEARLAEIDARRNEPLRRSVTDAPTGIHLGTIENLRQRAIQRPAMGPRTVFVVGKAEQMVSQQASQEAANAFLKLLEEPPEDVHIFLTTSRPGSLLPTVRSRVLSIRALPLANEEVAAFLEAGRSKSSLAKRTDTTRRNACCGRHSAGSVPIDSGTPSPSPLEARAAAFCVPWRRPES